MNFKFQLTNSEGVGKQYQSSMNLEFRASFHKMYSQNKESFSKWVANHYHIAPNSVALEVGCGTGRFWEENIEYLGLFSQLFLTDKSESVNSMNDCEKRMRKITLFVCCFLWPAMFQFVCTAADAQEATGILNRYISYYENRTFPSYFVGATTDENNLIIFSTDDSGETMAEIQKACGSTQFEVKLCEYSFAELETFQMAVLKNKEQYGISGSGFDFYNSSVIFYVDTLPVNFRSLPSLEKKIAKDYSSYPAAMTVQCEYAPWATGEDVDNHCLKNSDCKFILTLTAISMLIYLALIITGKYAKDRP